MGIFSALSPHPEVREAMAKTITEAECSKLTVPAGFLHLSSWGLQASGLQTLPAPPSPASNHKDVPSAHWLQWGARQRTARRPQTAEHQAAVAVVRSSPCAPHARPLGSWFRHVSSGLPCSMQATAQVLVATVVDGTDTGIPTAAESS